MTECFTSLVDYMLRNAGINLTGYHPPPPGLTPGPLIFFRQNPRPGTAFKCKTLAPGSKNETKIPTPGHKLPSLNAKRSMKKEHNSIKAVSFQIFFFRENNVFASLYTTLKINTV